MFCWHRDYFFRTFLLCSILASTSLCKYRNSPIHYIKLNSHGSGFNLNSLRNLAKLFAPSKDKLRERDKSYKGRKISSFSDKSSSSFGPSKVNYIKLGHDKHEKYQDTKKNFMNAIRNNEIFRPKLNFTSNAKPELLKYRDTQVAKTQILKKPSKELNRLNKKYSGKVPFHFGYSRKFQDFPMGKSIQKSSISRGGSSSMTWLSATKMGNGLPTSILHMKYPVKITKLSSGKNLKSEYFDNFIWKWRVIENGYYWNINIKQTSDMHSNIIWTMKRSYVFWHECALGPTINNHYNFIVSAQNTGTNTAVVFKPFES